jgi:site-specific DNA-methyltransferase (adenine-specific)
MIENNKIYNEDCLKTLKSMEDNSVDLILTSPPYNIGIDYDSYDDKKDWKEYYKWCGEWLEQCYRVLKSDGRIAIDHYLSLGTAQYRTAPIAKLYNIMDDIGFKHHSIAVWTDITLAKRTAWGSWLSASSPYINSPYEGVIIDYKDKWKKENKGESTIKKEDFIKLTRGVWDIKTETRGLTKANFSIDFASKIINLLSYKDDVVYDPFMGSGTTAIACIRNGRKYIGSEISPNYWEIANDRIKVETMHNKLF